MLVNERWAQADDGWPSRTQLLVPRASTSNGTSSDDKHNGGGTNMGSIAAGIVVIIVFIILSGSFILARSLRARNASPKYIPTQALKNRWRRWANISNKNRGEYSSQLNRDSDLSSLPATSRNANASRVTIGPTRMEQDLERGQNRGSAGRNDAPVDRQTSVRSVMTLPPYSVAARDSEQTLGREGERGGIDVVLEFPETAEDEENRRDEEMESLYQIRLARRAEAAEREERRRRRREARDRGDWAEVERLRIEARTAQQRRERELLGEDPVGNRSAARLIAEHQEEAARRERQRRVSSAQYAGIGDVRHDGTRVRGASNASARSEIERPLLDSAADMGGEGAAGLRRDTLSTLDAITLHHRNRSTSSVMSYSTVGTEDEEGGGSIYHPPFAPALNTSGHSRGRSGSGSVLSTNTSPDFEVVTLHSSEHEGGDAPRSRSRNASTSRLSQSVTPDGASGEPLSATEPPHYEHLAATEFGEPPEYISPVTAQPPQLSDLQRLPSITIEESRTPTLEPGEGPSLPGLEHNQHAQR